jgi:hypothetical protein
MSLNVCPAAVVAAPVEVVWGALADPTRWGEWIDGRVVSVIPPGPAAVGQVIALGARELGREWHPVITVGLVDPAARQLGFRGTFPLGLELRQRMTCTPIDASSCHVQFG